MASAAVLIVSWKPFEGTVAALRRLREAGLPLALVTNIISRTRATVAIRSFLAQVACALAHPVGQDRARRS